MHAYWQVLLDRYTLTKPGIMVPGFAVSKKKISIIQIIFISNTFY